MQVTENILDPQYIKRSPRDIMHMSKTGCQRRMLPKDIAPCWHRPWDQRQQEDQRAQGTYCGRPFFCSPGSAAAAACLFEDFAHSGPFHRHLRHSYAITCCRRAPPPARIRGWSMKTLKKDAIKKTEEAFKKKYSGIKANIHRTFIGEYLAFSPNTQ